MSQTTTTLEAGKQEALKNFNLPGLLLECPSYGNGHINDTYLASFSEEGTIKRYTLQHMNSVVFKDPAALMENIIHITSYLKEQITAQGGDPRRETLDFVFTRDGKPFFVDSCGEYWRAYHFVENVYALDTIKGPEDFYQSALAFGKFQRMLADFPADTLHETIAGFHDTKARFGVFRQAVADDICGRVKDARKEIDFILAREDVANVLGDLQAEGKLPLRVTHNDTKSNNVLIDQTTGKGLCVIDLDTVMPGLSVNDFGDSIRFGANTAAEDEPDVSKVSCDLELYEAYLKGFIEGCGGRLTQEEILCLPLGAKVMTFEVGMRFLTDYLSGDTYFKTAYPTHNLVRCRTQLALVADMEAKWESLREITARYLDLS